MKIVIGAALVILVALLGSRKTFTKIKLPLGARHLYLTGTEYIIVGWCLGSQMLDLLDSVTISKLSPLLYLALGWIGLMFGSGLDLSMIRRFPTQYFIVTMIQSITTVVVCALPMVLFFSYISDLPIGSSLMGAMALAAIAVPTGQSSLALVVNEFKMSRGKLTDLLSYIAGIDMAVGLAIFGFLFCGSRAELLPDLNYAAGAIYMASSLLIGIVTGWMLHMLTRVGCTQEELLLFTIGIVVFSTGVAAYMGISPLFVTATAGFVIANTKGAKIRIHRALASLEKPFYILVLLIGGALVDVGSAWKGAIILAGIYVALRILGKFSGGYLSAMTVGGPVNVPPKIGLGLVSQGGTSAAMAVSFYNTFGGSQSNSLLLVIFLSIIINELLSPTLVRRLIEKEA